MAEFVRALPPDIPRVLCHYTQASNLKSMLKGYAKSVCFWLKNNRDKNDKAELKMGIDLMTKVRGHLNSIPKSTLLDKLIDFENSYSLSFTEGEVSSHMLTEYGSVCLEFDLRGLASPKPQKCEYYTEEDIDDLAELYISVFNRFQDQSSIPNLFSWVMAEGDIIQKIATIKRKNEWEREGEWRIIVYRQQEDPRCFLAIDGSQRLAVNIPISFLKRITLFYNNENKDEMNEVFAYLIDWKKQNDVRTFDIEMKDAIRITK